MFNWLKNYLFSSSPEYIVLKSNEVSEVRYNGNSIYIHIKDQDKFTKQLKEKQDEVLKDIENQSNDKILKL